MTNFEFIKGLDVEAAADYLPVKLSVESCKNRDCGKYKSCKENN